ncbi:hypothetical protein HanIR_Chr01g0030711 [Helianthus annuus]|nr:hypothetical protein HanIR_Chr01g0030711 [Helianthus annuus]
MVLQLARIRKCWESGEDGTGGWDLNLLPTRHQTRPRTCRLRNLGRKNPLPGILLTACSKPRPFLNQVNNYLGSKGKGKANDYDSDDLFDREDEDDSDE